MWVWLVVLAAGAAATSKVVTVFAGINFQGENISFEVGEYKLPSGWNERIESLKVDNGYELVGVNWKNYYMIWDEDAPKLGYFWNNFISTIKVRSKTNELVLLPNKFQSIAGTYFSGLSQTCHLNLQPGNIIRDNESDVVIKLYVVPGYQVTLYTGLNQTGTFKTFNEDQIPFKWGGLEPMSYKVIKAAATATVAVVIPTTSIFSTDAPPIPSPTSTSDNSSRANDLINACDYVDVGVIVGSIAGVVVIVLLAFIIVKKRKKQHQQSQQHEQPYHSLNENSNPPMDIPAVHPGKDVIHGNTEDNKSSKQERVPTIDTNNNTTPSQDRTATTSDRGVDRRISALSLSNTNFELDVSYLRDHRLELVDLYVASNKPLASGAYGEVWLGMYGRQQVAIKRLKSRERTQVQMFINEIILYSQLDSDYIVRFIGASWTRPIEIECVVEYMNLGDLRNYLVTHPPNEFTWDQKYQSIVCIIRGLAYLHTYKVPIIHRDLKSRNVLLDSDKGTKFTDFGTSRAAEVDDTMTNGIGTYQWMAPEVILGTHYSTAADIFSFGIILSEFCTHQVPYTNLRPQSGKVLTQHVLLQEVCAGRVRPSFDGEGVPLWVKDMAFQCLELNPDVRPNALELAALLTTFRDKFHIK
ncbi:kinase [Thraustotheca clavata]|uniref:Kinase n=1 Tax=Thraustotheca clavata TaxID=74557 RepID=A0A1W0A4T9_9STRA|nr:kinase [Thraustotheca clavata]